MAETAEKEFTPRPYQVDLYERAVKENVIIYLPTGSGKTFISVLLIKHYSHQVQLPYDEGGKRIVFIVNTVPLVTQQSEYIHRNTGLKCQGYSGEMAVDFWTPEEWKKEFQEFQVLVMIGEIFHNVLNHGYMPLSKTCLLIFDECHKAVGSHPMRNIMKSFERFDKEEHPRILGLTATLLNANTKVEKVRTAIRELEITFHARIATVDSAISVRDYGNQAESFTYYDPPVEYGIEDKLFKIIDYMCEIVMAVDLKSSFEPDKSSKEFRAVSKNTKLKNMVEDTKEHIITSGLYGGSKVVLMHMIQLECIKKFSEDPQTIAVIEFLVTQMTKLRKIMCDKMKGLSELEQMFKFSSDRVLKTFSLLLHFHEKKQSDQKLCCIIFVRRRSTAQMLYHILKNLRLDDRFKFLHPEFMVGFSNNPYKNPRETLVLAKWNKEALLRFRNGQSNCIVATDVVDEGIDVPTCTLIIRYDLPNDYRGYMQSKGRARHKSALYAMLVARDDSAFRGTYTNFQNTDLFLKQELIGHSDERTEVSAEELDENLYKTEITPYTVTSVDGIESTVTGLSSIALINKYCTTLSQSKFISLTPTWILHKIANGLQPMIFKVALTLPAVSPLKETVMSDEMDSINLAKRSAALKACIRLHETKELTDRLLPVVAEAVLETTTHLFPHWENEPKEEAKIAGTAAKKRHHKTIHPKALYAGFPQEGQNLYLHIIQARPTYPRPYENRQMVFYDMLEDDAGFAIISTKPMPEIPCFPIFMNVGDLNVNVQVNHSKFTLSSKEIFELRQFHWVIFNDVLRTVKSFMAFDNANESNSFMIVPIDASGKIDWEIVRRYKTIERVSFEKNTPSDYDLALVEPNYRGSPSVYVVTQICEDIMAESSFPTDEFYSYVHYYKERHGLVIREPKQPMLEVKTISKKINCIRPRGLKAGLSKRKRADLLEDFQEHFVGELCNRVDFPALYWLKASYLPSVLHRISQLLIASDLRIQIVGEARLGVLNLQPECTWPPVIIKQTDDEETPEGLLDTSGCTKDDSGLFSELSVDIPGPEIDVLGLDSKLYPWRKDEEPTNFFREMEQIQLIDIEYYHQFMSSSPAAKTDTILKKPQRTRDFASRTILKTPPLMILSKTDPNGPSPGLLMQALTSKCAHDVFDLERLETLGDSLLKFAVSAYLIEAYPECNEGRLTVIKGKLIGNRYLYYCGKNKNIPGRIKVDDFAPMSNFTPPSFCPLRPIQSLLIAAEISPNVLYELTIPEIEQKKGVPSDQTLAVIQQKVLAWNDSNEQTDMQHFLEIQVVPDKTVSDSVEAIIGVYLSSMGLEGAFKILSWFGILPVDCDIKKILQGIPPSPILGVHDDTAVNRHLPRHDALEARIGYKFKNRAYLLQALTHPSFTPNTITPPYERLEFLGDAILDFLITVHIYESCNALSPGALTDLRSALVNNITFACLAVKYGFHVALLSYAPALHEIVDRFAKFQEERDHAVDDELLWILSEEEECNMSEYVDVPKVLGDLFESIVGAIYLDTGKDLKKVWEIVYGLIHNEIAAFSKNVPKQPVRVIHETVGAHPKFSKSSVVENAGKRMISLEVTIAGKRKTFHGFGANTKQAKCAAAKQALKCIRSNND